MADTRIRVAIIAPGEVYGGVERFVNVLSETLQDENEAEPLVILLHDGLQAQSLRQRGIEVIVPEQRSKYDPSLVKKLAEVYRRKRIDVVHTNGYKATILGAAAAKMIGLPVVKTEHGKLEPRTWLDPRHIRMRVNLLLDELSTRWLVDHIVYVTHDLQCAYRRRNLETGSIVYNGIPPIQLDTASPPPEIDSGKFNVGVIGRLAEVKGHLILLRALTHLRDLPDLAVHVIGEGPRKHALCRYCVEQELSDIVQFLGFRNDIYRYLAAFDLLVMPSLHEGLPYVLLESMSLGVPVVASNVGGLREILEDAEDALLVEPGNDASLAGAIRTLYEDQVLRERLARSAICKVGKDYIASAMARDYLEIYRTLLHPKAATQAISTTAADATRYNP
jgi:glycosyltransferase involved in cell wall biosynthesis